MKKILLLFFITLGLSSIYHISYSQIISPAGDTTICRGQSVTLEAKKGTYIYDWSTGDITSSITVSPVNTTTYSLRIFTQEEGAELISNHDFSKGNTGFTSDYTYVSSTGSYALWDEGKYAIGTNASNYHSNFSACNGPSGDTSERYMIVNGSPEPQAVIWSQVINVQPNKYYAFSTEACNVNPNNPAILEFRIGGVLMGDFIAPTAGQTCVWEEFYSLWYSGTNTSVEISIVNQNTIRSGNDYGLGGISFNPLVENPSERTIYVYDSAVLNLKDKHTICENQSVELNADAANIASVLWSTTGDGVFANPTSVTTVYTPGINDIKNGNVEVNIEAVGVEGCSDATASSTIIINSNPTVDLGSDQSVCEGTSLNLDAGNAGSTYLWSTGSTTQTISVDKSATYSVTVTDGNGCTASDAFQLSVNSNPTVDLGSDQSVCEGTSLNLDAGNAGSTYLWSTGSTTQTISVDKSATYSVTVTDGNGCTASDAFQLSVNSNPTVDLGSDQSVCEGTSLNLDAGNAGSTYLWSTGSTTQTISVDKSATYSVTVTDGNGCTASDAFQLSVNSNPTVDLGSDQSVCEGTSLNLDAGNAGSTYLWSTGSTTQTISVDKSATYSVTVTDGNGCSASDTFQLSVNSNPIVDLGSDQSVCEGTSLNLDAGNAGSTYLWNTGSTTQTISVDKSATYSVTVTDGNGCTASDAFQLSVNSNPTVDLGSDQSVCEGTSLNLDAGNAGSTYLWNTGSTTQTISVDKSATYSVTVTDGNGCTASDAFQLSVNSNPIVDLGSDQSVCEGTSLNLDAGNAGSTYLWSTGSTTQAISVDKSATYSVTVTDGNGCTASDAFQLSVNSNPTVDLGSDQSVCEGTSLNLDAGNAGSTYLWSTGSKTQIISVDKSATYSVTVTDGNGCTASDAFQLSVNSNPIVDLGSDQSVCEGTSLNLDAGNAGSTYLWSTGSTTQTISVDKSATYSVTVTDGNGCSASDAFQLSVNSNPIVDLGSDQSVCEGTSLNLDAGNAGSTYLWNTGSTTQTISVDKSATYSVTVTDGNGCTASDAFQLSVNSNPTVDLGSDQSVCEGTSLNLDAGNAGSTYLWSTGSTTQAISVDKSATYSVTVTDGNGCTASDAFQLSVNSNPTVDLGSDQSVCEGTSLNLDAGNAGSTYLWSTGSKTQIISVDKSATYSVTVTDGNGCSASDAFQLSVNSNPIVDLGSDQSVCEGTSLNLDAGNAGSTYLWSTGSTTQIISVDKSATYSVTVTDGNGCTASDAFQLSVNSNPIVDLGSDQSVCEGTSLNLDAGNAGSTYLWNTGSTTQTISVDKSATYSVTVTDGNGCTASDAFQLNVNSNPTVDLGSDQSVCEGTSLNLDAGNAGSTYLWSTGSTTQTISVNKSATYSVRVTNRNGCSANDTFQLTVNSNPVVDLGNDQSVCEGETVNLDAGNIGATYLWNTGLTTQKISVQKNGIYSVTVTDVNGCSAKDNFQLTVNRNPIVDLGSNQTICLGNKVILDAGVSGNKYLWNTGDTQQKIEISEKSGMYSVIVENEYGCTTKDSVLVTIIRLPNSPLEEKLDICYGESVRIDVGEGSRFLWSDGVTTQSRIVNKPGKYSVEVWDLNGCYGEDSIEVIMHDLPVVDLGPDLYICEGEDLILEAPSEYQVEWSPGGYAQQIYVNSEGTYELKATDEYGCTGQDEISIFVNENPEVDLGSDTVIGEGSSIILDAGSGYVEYEWSNESSSQTIDVDKSGDYSVKVLDVNGCRGDGKVKVAVNPLPKIDLGKNKGICDGTTLLLDAGKWERYEWSTGEKTRTILVDEPGEYIAKVWDIYDLMGIDTIRVHINPLPEIHLQPDTLSFYKGQTVSLDAGDTYSSYLWSTGENWRNIEVDEAGDYTLQVTNKFGCVAEDNIHVKRLKPHMAVPNVFTPNGGGSNEVFYPVFKGVVTDFEMYIYTRWGEQIFELKRPLVSNNELKSEGWDGSYRGKEAEVGVYVWIIFYGGKERNHGTVTLFK